MLLFRVIALRIGLITGIASLLQTLLNSPHGVVIHDRTDRIAKVRVSYTDEERSYRGLPERHDVAQGLVITIHVTRSLAARATVPSITRRLSRCAPLFWLYTSTSTLHLFTSALLLHLRRHSSNHAATIPATR